MTGQIIQFPRTADPLDFTGMDIKIDVQKEREDWSAMFTSMQCALRSCQFGHLEAEKAVRRALDGGDAGLFDTISADWGDDIDRFEALIAIMKAAMARLEISQDHAIAAPKTRIAENTIAMAEYSALRAENPDFLLFYRMGDFYELYFGDAEIAAKAFGIVLTQRGEHEGRDIPMCRVPVERPEECLNKLIRQGHRVALCDGVPPEARARGDFPHSRVVWRIASHLDAAKAQIIFAGSSYLEAVGTADHFLPGSDS